MMNLWTIPSVILASSSQVALSSINKINPSWLSISPNIKFKPSSDMNKESYNDIKASSNEAIDRMLSNNDFDYEDMNNNAYTSGLESLDEYYDSYQLAWRLLGFYVDCNYGDNDNKRRSLEEDDEGVCKRMVMYGVYVDLDYEGNGIGEYEFYDKDTGNFTCFGEYCRERMDCHLQDTNWRMLGIFKVDEISEEDGWMEQLFKHEGVCVWTEDEYEMADEMREEFPEECSEAEYYDDDGQSLYYDIKPEFGGNITLGLYTDSLCSVEYEGNDVDVYTIVGIEESYFDAFNSALNTYKICQPCVAYNLYEEDFQCDDEAGYTNCDQCMKFSNKAGSSLTNQAEISTAVRQNTLLSFELNGETYGSGGIGREYNPFQHAQDLLLTYASVEPNIGSVNQKRMFTFPLLILSSTFFVLSIGFYIYRLFSSTNQKDGKRAPLISSHFVDEQSCTTYRGDGSDICSDDGKMSTRSADPTIILGGDNMSLGLAEGICYLYDPENTFEQTVDREIVKYHRVASGDRKYQLKILIQTHYDKTSSEKANSILKNWDNEWPKFWQVYPTKESVAPVL